MAALELVVLLGVVILACGLAAHRTGVAEPILLLFVGAILGFVPVLQEVRLPPELMLLVFLPALLCWESITTSLRGIRAALRGILLSSTLLDDSATRRDEQYTVLRLALIARERAAVVQLRDEQRIDDSVLRQPQAQLDIEEIRLTRSSDTLIE